MPPTEHTQFPTIERTQDSDSPKQSLDTSSDVGRQSTSRNESSLTLGQTTQLPENIGQLKELESLEADTDLPLFDAVKTQDLISQDRPPALEPDRLTADEIQRITENIEAFLDTRGVSFEQIVHDPEFIHSLSSMGLAQMERVVLLGKIATSLDNTLSEDRTIDSHRFEKTDDHVFRLCINQLRDFAHGVPTSGISQVQNETYNPEWRSKIASVAHETLQAIILGSQERIQDEPDPEPITVDEIETFARPLFNIPEGNVEVDFFKFLAAGNLDTISWNLLPTQTETGGTVEGTDKKLLKETKEIKVFSPDRAQNFMDFYDAFGGKLVATEFDKAGTKYPYYGVIFEVEGSKKLPNGTNQPITLEVAYLERPAVGMVFKRSSNPNPQPGEPLYKLKVEKGSMRPETLGHDATYILVTEKAGQWENHFADGVGKKQAERTGARAVQHRGEGRKQWMDKVLGVIGEEIYEVTSPDSE